MAYNMNEQKSGFDPIASDRYTFQVEAATAEPHEKDGKKGHRVELTLRIVDGAFSKRKVWDNVYVPGALWRMRQLLQAAGKTAEATSSSIEAAEMAAAMVGTQFSAWLEASTGTNGAPRYDLKEYTAVNNGTSSEVEVDLDRVLG